jgi:peroxiredoxin
MRQKHGVRHMPGWRTYLPLRCCGAALLGLVWGLYLLGSTWSGADAESQTPRPSSSALAVGQQAPHFVARDLDGNAVALQEYHGHPVVLNFWATWCVPCRQELPVLQAAYAAYQEKGLVILAVNQDEDGNADAVRTYMANLGLAFRTLLDPDGKVATLYNVFLLPSTVFINASGSITATHIGPATLPQIERYLAVLLSQHG